MDKFRDLKITLLVNYFDYFDYFCRKHLLNVAIIKKKQSDNKQDPTNYHPISLKRFIGKLLEKIIKRRLSGFLEENNLIARCHSGFRAHRKTTDNLFFLTQKIKESFNKKYRYTKKKLNN